MNKDSFFNYCSKAEPINNLRDYRKVKRWVIKISVLYIIFTVLAVIVSVFLVMNLDNIELPKPVACVVVPAVILLTCLGYATLIMYFPTIFKSIGKSGASGYKVGEQITTTHTTISHEYGNTYKVSTHKEDEGCKYAFIFGVFTLMLWCIFCVYVGPFLTFGKIKRSIRNLKNYSPN